jgi:hypothetical protein
LGLSYPTFRNQTMAATAIAPATAATAGNHVTIGEPARYLTPSSFLRRSTTPARRRKL